MDRLLYRSDARRSRFAPVLVAYASLAALSLHAQLVTNTAAIPRADKPPVVFLNGYQQGCTDVSFASTFGTAQDLMQRDGRVSLFFNNCSIGGNNTSIEELGTAFGRYLDGLRYTDGSAVPQVDVVAHSMGGLIVRSYLAGKQATRGEFRPPADVKLRKAVFLAVPNFGSLVAAFATGDTQTRQLLPGSTFLYDLSTWNQGRDDLRGLDAVAVIGNAGTGILSGGRSGFDDSTVSRVSASLDFALPGRSRVVRHCHTTGLAAAACESGAPPIARWTNDQHDAARIALSFLNGNEAWRSIGSDAKDYSLGGAFVQLRAPNDAVTAIREATGLSVRENEIVWSDRLPAGETTQIPITTETGTASVSSTWPAGYTRAFLVKSGTTVATALPVFSDTTPRAVAPGMFLSIYGGALASSTAAAETQPYPNLLAGTEVRLNDRALPLQYVSAQQINAVLPEDISGLVKLTVRADGGQHTVNLLVEPAVPSVFRTTTNAQSGALNTPESPAHAGDYISVYLTGLGATEARADGLNWARQQPSITVGGQPCELLYAGRAPGYVGLDQINCRLPATLVAGDLELTVRSGSRVSNSITLPVR